MSERGPKASLAGPYRLPRAPKPSAGARTRVAVDHPTLLVRKIVFIIHSLIHP